MWPFSCGDEQVILLVTDWCRYWILHYGWNVSIEWSFFDFLVRHILHMLQYVVDGRVHCIELLNTLSIYDSDLLIYTAICSTLLIWLTWLIVLVSLAFRFFPFLFLLFCCSSTWIVDRFGILFYEYELGMILLVNFYFFIILFGPVPHQSGRPSGFPLVLPTIILFLVDSFCGLFWVICTSCLFVLLPMD